MDTIIRSIIQSDVWINLIETAWASSLAVPENVTSFQSSPLSKLIGGGRQYLGSSPPINFEELRKQRQWKKGLDR